MQMSNDEKGYYPQIGVAMTCRDFEEYTRMFSCEFQHGDRVLDVAAGASSFGADARSRGIRAVSADPLYTLSPQDMAERGNRELEEAEGKLDGIPHIYSWSYYGSPQRHEALRRVSLGRFLEDYGKLSGTDAYVPAFLPVLPFGDESFDVVLCSHFLFLYGEQFGDDFHWEAVRELVRVTRKGGEVRIYPLLDLKWKPYGKLEELMDSLQDQGLTVTLEETELDFIPGSRHLLVIRR